MEKSIDLSVRGPRNSNPIHILRSQRSAVQFPCLVRGSGRSNVGKASLLIALTRQWGVVRTSDKPGLTQVMVSSKSGAGIRSLRTVLAKIAPLRRAACTIVLAWKPKVSKLIEVPDVFDADCSPTQIEQGCRYSLAMPLD
ncbi:hypothetical protein C1H46_010319 [Malus baccata]|uniref:G domain-containing protein n=1 Tax=Malus baccata TaxID=106549 RepID=A0A540MZC2_MALBA|nr:hypothetical protein C1H46_010319 [Malus baccata]